MATKIYSDVTKQFYDTLQEAEKAEADAKAKAEAEAAAAKKKDNERAARAKEVEDAYRAYMEAQRAYIDAQRNYNTILSAFLADYQSFHMTIRY